MNAVKRKFAHLEVSNNLSIVHTAHKGIKATIFYSFAHEADMTESNLAGLLHMHPRTLQNYREKQKKLDPPESEHLLKLIALYMKGVDLFRTVEEFNRWLKKPAWKTNEKPFDLLITPGGIDLVSDELDRLAYGYVV